MGGLNIRIRSEREHRLNNERVFQRFFDRTQNSNRNQNSQSYNHNHSLMLNCLSMINMIILNLRNMTDRLVTDLYSVARRM